MIIAAALAELGPRLRELGGDVRLEIDSDLPDLYVDDVQTVQVLVILLNNALDAAGSPRRVTVRALRPAPGESLMRLEVRDEGTGIPPEILGRIFDPFFTTKASGTGLGLSIAQHIVAENGGEIDVSAPRGGLTTFAVSLPAGRP